VEFRQNEEGRHHGSDTPRSSAGCVRGLSGNRSVLVGCGGDGDSASAHQAIALGSQDDRRAHRNRRV